MIFAFAGMGGGLCFGNGLCLRGLDDFRFRGNGESFRFRRLGDACFHWWNGGGRELHI